MWCLVAVHQFCKPTLACATRNSLGWLWEMAYEPKINEEAHRLLLTEAANSPSKEMRWRKQANGRLRHQWTRSRF